MAANPARRGFSVQVQASSACWINGQTGATMDWHSLKIDGGAFYARDDSFVGTGGISIACAGPAGVYSRER